jgi:hypothetical protein
MAMTMSNIGEVIKQYRNRIRNTKTYKGKKYKEGLSIIAGAYLIFSTSARVALALAIFGHFSTVEKNCGC